LTHAKIDTSSNILLGRFLGCVDDHRRGAATATDDHEPAYRVAPLSELRRSDEQAMAERRFPDHESQPLGRDPSADERLAFLTSLLNTVEQAVIATDNQGRILHWNRFAEKLYGWPADETSGRDISDLLLPDNLRDHGRAVITALARGERGPRAWVLQRRDGSAVHVHATSSPILDGAGKIVGVVGVSWDVSEKERLETVLHQTEIRLRLIAEQLPATVWATDADLRIVWNAGAAFRTLGTDPSSLIGKTVAEAVRESEGRLEAVDAHIRALAGETVTYEGGAREIVTQAVVQPFREPTGHITGTVGVALDITERKRIERELSEKRAELQMLSRRMLEAQEGERRALARELHDDFGQLLTAIRLSMEAARRTSSGGGQHLTDGITLIDQALDKVRSLALDLRPAILDDLGLIAALRWLIKRQSQSAGFEGRLLVGPLSARLSTDVTTCSFRVVQEALTNVVRHAAARNVVVELIFADRELRVVVRDDGRGFDVPAARQLAARGLSLGLLSMQERVTLVGGHLVIDSTPGEGTTIDARVPLAVGDVP
jgi:PAS domain S-box-containing protein